MKKNTSINFVRRHVIPKYSILFHTNINIPYYYMWCDLQLVSNVCGSLNELTIVLATYIDSLVNFDWQNENGIKV